MATLAPFSHPKEKKPTSYDLQPQVAKNFKNTGFECFFPHFFQQKKGENL